NGRARNMAWTRTQIHEATGFDNGDLFRSEAEVREYFTVENMRSMFGECSLSQDELDEMAEEVIRHGWHMVRRPLWCPYCGARFELESEELEKLIGPNYSDPAEWTPQAVADFLAEHSGHRCWE